MKLKKEDLVRIIKEELDTMLAEGSATRALRRRAQKRWGSDSPTGELQRSWEAALRQDPGEPKYYIPLPYPSGYPQRDWETAMIQDPARLRPSMEHGADPSRYVFAKPIRTPGVMNWLRTQQALDSPQLVDVIKEELDAMLSELGFGEGKPAPDELSKKRVINLEEEEEIEEDKKKTKVSKSGQKRVSKKIGHLVGKEDKSQEQAAAIAYSMENRGELKKGGKHSVG